jgi:4-hydroxy-3-methylbut-2-enyl diphosphate reductase
LVKIKQKYMKILIDPHAGFCPGVKHVITLAERQLADDNILLSLGEIIHNPIENERLESKGLQIVNEKIFDNKTILTDSKRLLLRAHGEPPSTFVKAKRKNIDLIDGTCPIVKRSQDAARSYLEKGFQVVIVGKANHPEVLGIVGHCKGRAIVVSEMKDLQKLDGKMKTFVLAQTTISNIYFHKLIKAMQNKGLDLTVQNTICRFVSNRIKKVKKFAQKCDLLILVGGKNSSNTKVLYETCHKVVSNLFWIEKPIEIQRNWIKKGNIIGITGSASTPLWLLEETKEYILNL